MEQLIVLILFVLALTYLIYRCATGRQAMPEGGIQVKEEPATEETQEPTKFPKIYIPAAARSSRRRAYGARAAGTGAALLGSWRSDFSYSPFRGGDFEMENNPSPGSDFTDCLIPTDCSISTGGFIDMMHGGIDPTGQGGMAGDFNPDHHFDDSFSHSDPFDSGFGTNDFGGIDNSIGCDISIGCGIAFE